MYACDLTTMKAIAQTCRGLRTLRIGELPEELSFEIFEGIKQAIKGASRIEFGQFKVPEELILPLRFVGLIHEISLTNPHLPLLFK